MKTERPYRTPDKRLALIVARHRTDPGKLPPSVFKIERSRYGHPDYNTEYLVVDRADKETRQWLREMADMPDFRAYSIAA